MIRKRYHTSALKCIQALAVWTRALAREQASYPRIEETSDAIEYLSGLAAEEKDRTEQFFCYILTTAKQNEDLNPAANHVPKEFQKQS